MADQEEDAVRERTRESNSREAQEIDDEAQQEYERVFKVRYEKRKYESLKLFSTVSTIVATIGASIAMFVSFVGERRLDFRPMPISALALLKSSSKAEPEPPEPPEPVAPPPANTSAFEKRIAAIEKQQSDINQILLNDPQKALSIPLMRRDIEQIKSDQTLMDDALKIEIERVYDLNKWIIGGLGAGVLGLVANQFLNRKAKLKDEG